MATAQQIADLRKLVNEPDQTNYDDAALNDIIDANGGVLSPAASFIWQEKAAKYAELVNTSESGSSRAMGDLHKQALTMADRFDRDSATSSRGRATHIRSIERP